QIAEDPDDLVARLELLSIYYADNRIDEFRDAALDMQPYVNDPREAEWVQVRAMGEDLLPDDPLFRSGDRETDPAHAGFVDVGNDSGANAESELRWSSDDDDRVEPIIDITQTRVVDTPVVAALDDERRYAPAPEVEMEVDESETFEFDDEADVVVADAASDRNIDDDIADAMEEPRGMEFSLEDAPEIDAVRAAPAMAVAAERELPPKGRPLTEYASEAKRPDQSFEFDLPPLDFDTEFSKPASVTAVEPSHDLDDPIELDEEFLVGEDALGTKLDLARAYADMGDPDGARGMLEEVLSQGDAGQKDKARKLLEELG
ncbi:MAG: FimV/HubP family polar landmark protein, partial [Dokdonella sp.]